MKKLFLLLALFLSINSFAQFTYKLSNISVISVAVDPMNTDTLNITAHITTTIDECPYEGKFEQIDYGVVLRVSSKIWAKEISANLPVFAQDWIDKHYYKK